MATQEIRTCFCTLKTLRIPGWIQGAALLLNAACSHQAVTSNPTNTSSLASEPSLQISALEARYATDLDALVLEIKTRGDAASIIPVGSGSPGSLRPRRGEGPKDDEGGPPARTSRARHSGRPTYEGRRVPRHRGSERLNPSAPGGLCGRKSCTRRTSRPEPVRIPGVRYELKLAAEASNLG